MKKIRVLFLIILVLLLSGCAQKANGNTGLIGMVNKIKGIYYIPMVANSKPEIYKDYDVTYKKVFAAFFNNAKWEYFKSEDGDDIVEFSGKCLILDELSKVNIQFNLDQENENIEMTWFGINDEGVNDFIGALIIMKAFDSYMEEKFSGYRASKDIDLSDTDLFDVEEETKNTDTNQVREKDILGEYKYQENQNAGAYAWITYDSAYDTYYIEVNANAIFGGGPKARGFIGSLSEGSKNEYVILNDTATVIGSLVYDGNNTITIYDYADELSELINVTYTRVKDTSEGMFGDSNQSTYNDLPSIDYDYNLDDVGSGESAWVVGCNESITLRPEPNTGGEITQIPLYAELKFNGMYDNVFSYVTYNGISGYVMSEYLDVFAPELYTGKSCRVINAKQSITLRTSPYTTADEILQIPVGAIVNYIDSRRDFHLVMYNGQVGYALASYLEFIN